MDTSVEKMAKLPTAFKKNGTVTAGNASGINDAAAALLVMSASKAKELGLKPLVKIRTYARAAWIRHLWPWSDSCGAKDPSQGKTDH